MRLLHNAVQPAEEIHCDNVVFCQKPKLNQFYLPDDVWAVELRGRSERLRRALLFCWSAIFTCKFIFIKILTFVFCSRWIGYTNINTQTLSTVSVETLLSSLFGNLRANCHSKSLNSKGGSSWNFRTMAFEWSSVTFESSWLFCPKSNALGRLIRYVINHISRVYKVKYTAN